MIRMVLMAALAIAPATVWAAPVPPPMPAAPAPPAPVLGTWSNPKGTLAVRTAPCGTALCGAIIWAGPQAIADARDAGVTRLVGTELLQDYRPIGRGSWSGRVFIPDMGHSFSSRIRQTAPNELTISGCLVASLFCRSQVWHRVG